ncbi:NAD(P)/FAD-dependent oxidoreductase [Nocardia sp. NPDC050712]|uniref:FAD-dependent oxidoreductase n=1 Tax=Nocardia sp. NPDC050712 TaxID=3155518 RepID=UPI0033FA587F
MTPETCLVVGAGPVGLVAALAAARKGLPTVVLEAEPRERVRPGSRAIVLMYPSLRRLDSIMPGLSRRIRAAGMTPHGYDALYAGRRVFSAPVLNPGLMSSLPQRVTEQLLYAECLAHGVEFRWQAPVTGLDSGPDGVTLTLADGQRLAAGYVIGADGARSVVRTAIGARMRGSTDPTPFLIVDVDQHPDGSTPLRGYFHYRCPELDGRNVMHMPFAGGLRVDLQCAPGDDVEFLSGPEGIGTWMPKVVDPWYAEHVQWVSHYRFHQVVAESYTDTHRRVLLAGEAAHLFAPWGGRGLNSGIFDATDAAHAIAAAVADPHRRRRLIEDCAERGRRWGRHNRDISSKGLRRMRGNDPRMRLQRGVAARLAPAVWPAGAWLANGPVQVPVPRPGARGFY